MADKLVSGNAPLAPSGTLVSPNKTYMFVNQSDGNLVVYKWNKVKGLWASDSQLKGVGNLVMQTDGNLVLYNTNDAVDSGSGSNAPIWASQTNGKGTAPFTLVMQDDGNLVIYDEHKQPTWATNTNGK